jgi:hypothetical protein
MRLPRILAPRQLPLALAMAMVVLGAVTAIPDAALAAQPFTMRTDATYRVDPTAHRVMVTMGVTFTNTTPDTPGIFSLYSSIPISLQAGASRVSARDASGALGVSVLAGRSRTLATIRLRSSLRYLRSAKFTVSYRLTDGASASVRVRPSMVVVPVWCFGTDGSTSVQVPTGFSTQVTGAKMVATSSRLGTQLASGRVANPGHWRALVTAAQPPVYSSVTRSVPLVGGTVDLQVRAWSDDAAWGTRTLALAAAALPRLQKVIGLPYTAAGPLVLSEAAPAGIDPLAESGLGAQGVGVAFNAPPFTVLHQLAHVWIAGDVVSSRWIREGLASLAAARVAPGLKVPLPYRAATQSAALKAEAFPLDTWETAGEGQVTQAGGSADVWAYAASWAFMDRIAAQLGPDAPFVALQRATAGTSPYEKGDPGDTSGAAISPLDSHQLLDQLEEASDAVLDGTFRSTVFGDQATALLAARAEARRGARRLVDAAGDWGLPQPIVTALDGWRFDEATAAIATAASWLRERDALIARASASRITIPGRLVAAWRADGGDARAQAELNAERAVLDAYETARERIGEPNPVQALGMLGGPQATELLATGAGLFAAGDLTGAVSAIERGNSLNAGAQASGVVRLGIGAALLAVATLMVALAVRRVRQFAARRAAGRPLVRPPSV